MSGLVREFYSLMDPVTLEIMVTQVCPTGLDLGCFKRHFKV